MARYVIYQGQLCLRGIPYDYRLEITTLQGERVLVKYGDPELIRAPTPEQLAALTPKTRKKRTKR